jgi:predicted HAD superfamily Cof-like phosphohydrolase
VRDRVADDVQREPGDDRRAPRADQCSRECAGRDVNAHDHGQDAIAGRDGFGARAGPFAPLAALDRAVAARRRLTLAAMEPLELVREFHRAAGSPVAAEPTLDVSADVRDFRLRLIAEELAELRAALAANDLVGTADALADLLYVVYGAALVFGIPVAEVFAEVHRSNMAKVSEAAEWLLRDDGKVLKPHGWAEPRIADILERHSR